MIEGLFDSLQRLGELGAVPRRRAGGREGCLGFNQRAFTTLSCTSRHGLSWWTRDTVPCRAGDPEMGDAWSCSPPSACRIRRLRRRWRQEVGDEADLPKWQITSHIRYLGQIKNLSQTLMLTFVLL
jgi:hypothetical protein